MDVILDNKPLRSQPTLAAALRSGVTEAARTGRIVVEAHLDGEAMAETILENPPEEEIGVELRLTSVEPRSLVRVTLMDAADALERAREEQRSSANLIQTGKIEEAMSPLSAALQTWQAVREAVEKSVALVPLPLGAIESKAGATGADGLVEMIGELSTRLQEVKRSLAAEDWSSLADVLDGDLTDEASRWVTMLRTLSEGLRSGS